MTNEEAWKKAGELHGDDVWVTYDTRSYLRYTIGQGPTTLGMGNTWEEALAPNAIRSQPAK